MPELEIIPPAMSEGKIQRNRISLAMILAGVGALSDCEENRELGRKVTDSDLVCAIYAAMKGHE